MDFTPRGDALPLLTPESALDYSNRRSTPLIIIYITKMPRNKKAHILMVSRVFIIWIKKWTFFNVLVCQKKC